MRSLFVGVGQDGLRVASDDGATWRDAQTGKEGETYRGVAFGNRHFAAVGSYGGDNIFASSGDGATWEIQKKEAKYVRYVRGVGFDGQQFLGIGGDPGAVGDSKPFVLTSADGTKWSDFTDVAGKAIIRRLAFGPGVAVGVGDRGRRAASRDGGRTWQDAADAKAIDTLTDVAYGAGKFVGVGLNGLRMHSEDGLAWSAPERGEEGEHLNTVIWTGDQFAAIGFGGTYFSPDGITWKREGNQGAPLTACYGGGTYVGTQWKGRLLVSKDAITWTQAYKGDQHVEAVCWGSW